MLQYGPALRRYFMRRANSADADDLVQDVFVQLHTRDSGAEIENVEGYLFRTAVSVLNRQRRRNTWRWGQQEVLETVADELDERSPERILLGRETVARVVAAVRGLPRRRAEAFALSKLEHLSNEEVARRMGISVKSVEELLRLALAQLLAELGPDR